MEPLNKETLIARIEAAFRQVPAPAGWYGIYHAEAADDYRSPTPEEEIKDRRLFWWEVLPTQIVECPSALNFLKQDGYHHYIPAYMMFTLRYFEDEQYNGKAVIDAAEYSLSPTDSGSLKEWQEARHGCFTAEQVAVIIDFLRYRMKQSGEWMIEDFQRSIRYWEVRLSKL